MAANIPDEIQSAGRPPVPDFEPTEQLFRRFPSHLYVGGELEVDSITLPDISVMREMFTADINWVLMHPSVGDPNQWGVMSFQVADVPPRLLHNGIDEYRFVVAHTPQRRNYAHSDVQAHFGEEHLTSPERIPKELHLRFREQLLYKIEVRIIRDGKTITKKVEIGELPKEEDLALSGVGEGNGVNIKRLEITVSNLTEEQKGQLEDDKSGVYVFFTQHNSG